MYPSSAPQVPTTVASDNANLVRKLWANKFQSSVAMTDTVYANQMGDVVSEKPRDGARVVEVCHDTAVGRGQEVTFTIRRGFYHKGLRGGTNTTFTSTAQYNVLATGYDKVKVDLKRESAYTNTYTDEVMGWGKDIQNGSVELLGELTGRRRQRDLMMTTMWQSSAENKIYANGRTSINSLTSSDTLKKADITRANAQLGRLGAAPAYVRMDGNGNDVPGYHVITTHESYAQLKLDPEVVADLRATAAAVGNDSVLEKGGLRNLDGNTVQWFESVMHPDAGEVASPFNPTALLGIAIGDANTPVTTSEAITGGRNTANANNTEVEYMTDFPWTYTFLNGVTLSTAVQTLNPYYTNRDFWGFRGSDTSTANGNTADTDGSVWDANPYFYVGISNPLNAAVQPGKWSIYKIAYSANNGNRFTGMLMRLGPTNNGIQATQVGDVTFDSNTHATYHGPESVVFLCTPGGVPLANSPVHGASALRRAWGEWKDRTDKDKAQAINTFIYSDNIMGHGLRRDANGRAIGVMNIVHAIRYYDIKHA